MEFSQNDSLRIQGQTTGDSTTRTITVGVGQTVSVDLVALWDAVRLWHWLEFGMFRIGDSQGTQKQGCPRCFRDRTLGDLAAKGPSPGRPRVLRPQANAGLTGLAGDRQRP
jgi:hypothetical protein